jgi:hypothetical protein
MKESRVFHTVKAWFIFSLISLFGLAAGITQATPDSVDEEITVIALEPFASGFHVATDVAIAARREDVCYRKRGH